MEFRGLPECPACGSALQVTRLRCPRCETEVHGAFRSTLAGLTVDQQLFAERFLRARGNLKELEREVGLGYQTLRGQLDEVVAALEAPPRTRRSDVLGRLRRGELRAEEALQLLEQRSEADDDDTGGNVDG